MNQREVLRRSHNRLNWSERTPGSRRQKNRNRFRGAVHEAYDAIVVGTGIGGLVAATMLARSGRRVLALDQHYIPGGCTTSFRRGPWVFDVGLHYIGDCRPGGNVRRIMSACGVDDLVFESLGRDLEEIHLPGIDFAFPASRAELGEHLIRTFPTERRGIERYLRLLSQVAAVDRAGNKGKGALLWALLKSPLVCRYLLSTLGRFVDSCTRDKRLRAILTIQSGLHGCAPNRVSAMFHSGLQNHYLNFGGFYPRGGGGHISHRVAEEFEAAGGDLRLRSPVTKILVEGGRATGVVYDNKHLGRRVVHAPVIVSNVDLKKTVVEMVGQEHFPKRFAQRMGGLEMSLPYFVVFLGVSIPPSRLPVGKANVWVGDRLDLEAEYRQIEAGVLPMPPMIFMTVKSLKDSASASAPPGHSNIEVITVVPPHLEFWQVTAEQFANGSYGRDPAYIAVKNRIADACIDQAARVIPNLRENIVYREAATPLTHTRYTRASDGGPVGSAGTVGQFLRRPGPRSGLPGLYLCGTNCSAGPGVVSAMGSAFEVAHEIVGPDGIDRCVEAAPIAPPEEPVETILEPDRKVS